MHYSVHDIKLFLTKHSLHLLVQTSVMFHLDYCSSPEAEQWIITFFKLWGMFIVSCFWSRNRELNNILCWQKTGKALNTLSPWWQFLKTRSAASTLHLSLNNLLMFLFLFFVHSCHFASLQSLLNLKAHFTQSTNNIYIFSLLAVVSV